VMIKRGLIFIIAICLAGSSYSFAQRRQPVLVCKRPVLAALKPPPKLNTYCGQQASDWDERILKLPARVPAMKGLMSELASLSDAAWWSADPVDLSVCDFTQKTGALTPDQRQDFLQGEYLLWLWGNDRIRLMLIPDPCYHTEYGGSNAFLLYRTGGKVVVSQVLDGYFSRADNSVGLGFAKLKTEEIVEVSTGSGGLNPSLTNYYFAIDPRTKQAVPKNLFRDEHGPTNQVSSAMLLEASGTEPLKVLRGNALAPSFVVYVAREKGKIEDSGRTLSRKILRWNGNVYR
jgi:hypothetical protein